MVLTDRGTTMKIMQVIPYFCFGGAETMCENLCYAQMALGHDVVVVSLYNEHTPIVQRMEASGVRILYLDKKLGMDVSMVPKLLGIMRREKPDVVHTHLDVIKYAVAAAKLAGIRTCVHTVHNVAQKEAEGLSQKINRVYFRLGWSRPVALSPEVQKTIAAVYRLPEENIPVIYNGIDLSRCVPKTDYSCQNPPILLHIGRFNEQKNHDGLLRAFQSLLKQIPQCKLHLVGDGELKAEMETLACTLGVAQQVVFCGSQSDVHPYLQEADLFLLPSNYEGMPMTIIEAMGTGLPIVATAVGGVPDMVEDGVSALLTTCDVTAVCEACIRLLEDAELRATMGKNAHARSSLFSAQEMARRYCEIYM